MNCDSCPYSASNQYEPEYCSECLHEKERQNKMLDLKHNHYNNLTKYKKNGIKNVVKSNCFYYREPFYYDKTNRFNSIHRDIDGNLYSQRLNLKDRKRFYKRLSNKKIRKTPVSDYGNYKKIYDMWWNIF